MDAPATLVELQENGFIPPAATGMLQDLDQISAAAGFARALQAVGSKVHYHLYSGGHEIRPWKEEFAQAVQWLYQEIE